jgi:hypothetical protein
MLLCAQCGVGEDGGVTNTQSELSAMVPLVKLERVEPTSAGAKLGPSFNAGDKNNSAKHKIQANANRSARPRRSR